MQLHRRTHPPGTAPGTLRPHAAGREPVRVHVTRYSLEHLQEVDLLSPDGLGDRAPGETTWVDIEGVDVRVVEQLAERLGIHPLALEDMVNLGQRPKVEEYEGCLFVVVPLLGLPEDDGHLETEQISLLLLPDTLLTVRERPSELFEPLRARLRGGKARIRGGGPGYLAYAVVDTVVDHCFPLLDALGERLERLEDSILASPDPEDLAELHVLRRILAEVRRSIRPLRDVLGQLLRDDSSLFTTETRLYLRDAADHVNRALDSEEVYREMVASLTEIYLTGVSNRMNEVMKVLTMIATIFIPLSFIAGVYGMNFDPAASRWSMPELGWAFGYPAVLGVMATVAAALLVFFRRRRWF